MRMKTVLATFAAAMLLVLSGSSAAQTPGIPLLEKFDGFTHGPMLGNVTSHSVRVWARTRKPGSFSVLYSTSPDLGGAASSAAVRTTWEHDATGWIELTGLKANTKYYYALVLDGRVADTRVNGRVNSFLTLPEAASFAHFALNPKGLYNFSFEIGTGNKQVQGKSLPTFSTMLNNLKDRIYFQIQNGDWIYEEGRETTEQQWATANNVTEIPDTVAMAKGIAGVWENYKLYLQHSKPLADFYREVPQFVTIDDHDILNDVLGSGQTGFRFDARGRGWQQGLAQGWQPELDTWVNDLNVERAVFRDPALAAWDDYVGWTNPDIGRHQQAHFGVGHLKQGDDVLTDSKADFTRLDLQKITNLHVLWGFGNTGVYEIVRVLGAHRIEVRPSFIVTEDARYSIGSNHYSKFRVSNAEFFLLDDRSNRTLHQKKNDPSTSMLDKAQEEWLIEGLQQSDADILFVVSSVNMAVPHDLGAWYGKGLAAADKDETWNSYLFEREKLLKVMESLHKLVIVLTGDLHKSYVARMSPGIYDVGTGPHTSNVHRLADAGGSPPSGWYDAGAGLVNIIWSSNQYRNDSPSPANSKGWPIYTSVRLNNAYNIPDKSGRDRWIAYPEPQVLIEFHDGYTGDLVFAYAMSTSEAKPKPIPVPLERVKVLCGISETQ